MLTLVHPDFLPPVYASAQTLRDLGCNVHILTFDSFVESTYNPGERVSIQSIGKFHNEKLFNRIRLKTKFRQTAKHIVSEYKPHVIISFCPFSYLVGLKVKQNVPIIYIALEVANVTLKDLKRSPLSSIDNYLTFKRASRANLIATPSVERSAWFAGRTKIDYLPPTVLNTSYYAEKSNIIGWDELRQIVPADYEGKILFIYTGAVNDRLSVSELVAAFCKLEDDRCRLVVTGMKDNTYCNSIRTIVNHSKFPERVQLLPYVTRNQLVALQNVATIGVSLSKVEYGNIASYMIAPNKIGEYFNSGTFVIATKNEYINNFKLAGVAETTDTNKIEDIYSAYIKVIQIVTSVDVKSRILEYVKDTFCMQRQLEPIIEFINNI